MTTFNNLLEVIDRLLGPNGCPWDKAQTLVSMKKDILEEVYELLDAIDSNDDFFILDEMGDVLLCVALMARIAQKDRGFSIEEILKNLIDKLIRRHPHVFSDTRVNSKEQVLENWAKIKKTEKSSNNRKTLFDSIPKSMPTHLKAEKLISLLKRNKYNLPKVEKIDSEEALSKKLFEMLLSANESNLSLESALQKVIRSYQEMSL